MSKIVKFLKIITIEPILLLYYTGEYALLNVVENFRLERYCRVELNRGEDCDNLGDGSDEDLEADAQKLENLFMVYESYIGAILPVILLAYLASWSDKHGRLVPMLLALVGWTLYCLIYLLASLFPSWSAWVLLSAAFLRSTGGGKWIVMMATYAYFTDITTEEDRTTRMALLMGMKGIGMAAGTALGPIIRDVAGYAVAYFAALIIFVICIIWSSFKIPHYPYKPDDPSMMKSKMQRIKRIPRKIKQNLLELIHTAVKKREGYTRFFINYFILMMLLFLLSQPEKLFLWSRIILKWDLNTYSTYSFINQVICTVATFITTPLIKYFNLHDCTIGAMILFAMFCKALALGLITNPSQWWVLYMFTVIPAYIPSVCIRSLLSKQSGSAEVGRVMSLLCIWECFWPVVNNTLYGGVYGATVDSYPSAIHLVTAGVCIMVFASFLGVHLLQRNQELKNTPYKGIEEDEATRSDDGLQSRRASQWSQVDSIEMA